MPSAGGKGSRTRKTLSFFRVNFGHAPPYQVLCDGPTIFQSLSNDLYLKQALPNLLGAPAYPAVTECVLKELRSLGETYSNAAVFAKRVKRMSCVHEGEASVAECLVSLLQKHSEAKLVLATNDPDVVAKVARIPGVPIVSILNQKKFVLKAPSPATLRFVKESENVKNQGLSDADKALVDGIKAAERQFLEKRLVRKKRMRAKGPNPLSVKKRKLDREKSGGNQGGSSLYSGSAVSPDDTLTVPDTRSGKTDGLDSKRTGDQVGEIKLRQADVDSQDADEAEANRKRIRRVGKDSCEFADLDGDSAIKDLGSTARKVTSGPRITPKSGRRRRRKKQKETDETGVASNTAQNLSGTVNPKSVRPRAEGSSSLKETQGTVDGSSQRRTTQNVSTRTAECKQGASSRGGSAETKGQAIAGGAQPLDRESIPTADELELSKDKVAESVQMKQGSSEALQNGKKDELHVTMEGRKNIACNTDNTHLTEMTEMDKTRTTRESEMRKTSSGVDGTKKKKQRKNRRRRPKNKGSD